MGPLASGRSRRRTSSRWQDVSSGRGAREARSMPGVYARLAVGASRRCGPALQQQAEARSRFGKARDFAVYHRMRRSTITPSSLHHLVAIEAATYAAWYTHLRTCPYGADLSTQRLPSLVRGCRLNTVGYANVATIRLPARPQSVQPSSPSSHNLPMSFLRLMGLTFIYRHALPLVTRMSRFADLAQTSRIGLRRPVGNC